MNNNELFASGNFGLERETLRVNNSGRLARTKHPFDDPSVTRDFCENQIEIVTGVCPSVRKVVKELERLDGKVREKLNAMGESLWMYSNPPRITTEAEIPVAQFSGEAREKTTYREYLQSRYGKRLMLYSGVHFNFSFTDEYLDTISDKDDLEEFKKDFYLRLYKQVCMHSWLLLLLTASSPVYDKSLDADGEKGAVRSPYSSMRSSDRGYWNSFVPVIDCTSLDSFVNSIQSYVDSGKLISPSELYLPVRLKPKGTNDLEGLSKGVSHIELRMFDLDPTRPLGVNENDLEFAHLLLMYLSRQPDFDFTPQLQRQAVKNHKNAALCSLIGVEVDGVGIIKKAAQIIDGMKWFFSYDKQAMELLEYERRKLYHRPCMQIRTKDIYNTKKEGDNNVRASRIFRKKLHRYTHTAAGVLLSLR